MIGKLLCWLGLHDYIPEYFLTCNPNDIGRVCRRCFKPSPTARNPHDR